MGRRDEILKQMVQEEAANARVEPWEKLKLRIKQGTVLPIISNSFRIEQIFRENDTLTEVGGLSTYEQLTEDWASLIKYPMKDTHDLAQVAQYHLVNIQKERKGESQARTQYLQFLKRYLLTMAKSEQKYTTKPAFKTKVDGLGAEIEKTNFSEIATQLDYPRFPDAGEDPLHLLAQLDLPIYITTSQSDFLERALIAVNKQPKTQICFWDDEIPTKPEHKTDPDFEPTKDAPMVYHLFGLEDYPQTLVLSEEDYVNFLISVVENKNTQNPLVPSRVRLALGQYPLILIGYHLRDWDFRVLFRFIQNYERSDRSMVVQIKPSEMENLEDLERYLEDYFDIRKFDVEWNTDDSFIQKLCKD